MANGFVLWVIWLRLLTVTCMDQKTQQLVKRLEDSRSETFFTLPVSYYWVFHIELDHYRPGNIIFTDHSSLKTSDGVTTTVIAGNSSNWGYKEGVGVDALFYGITGFSQISQDRIIAAEVDDGRDECLRMIHRENSSTSIFSGQCNKVSDMPLHINSGPSVIKDHLNPNQVLFTNLESTVQSVDIDSRVVQTFATFEGPAHLTFLTQVKNGDIYVLNYHAVYRIDYFSKEVTLIAGEKLDRRVVDGSLAESRFFYPRGLIVIGHDTLLVADTWNSLMRLIDLDTDTVSTINIGSGNTTLRSPHALLLTNDSLYIGYSGQILQFPYLCWEKNRTFYVTSGTEKAKVEIAPGVEIELPVGSHTYKTSQCNNTVLVISNELPSTTEPSTTLPISSSNIPLSTTSDPCTAINRTFYVTSETDKAKVEIAPGVEIKLPVGSHTYKTSQCIYTVLVISNDLSSTTEPPTALPISSSNIPLSTTSDLCQDRNRTFYVASETEKAKVEIAPGVEIELPVGSHTYKTSQCSNTVQVISNASAERCGELLIDNAKLVRTSYSDMEGSQIYYQCNTKVTSGDGLYTCTKTTTGLEWTGDTLICQRDIIVPVLTGIFIPALVITGSLLIVFCLKLRLSRLNPNTLNEQSNNAAESGQTGTRQHPQYEELCLNNLPMNEYAVPEPTSGSEEIHDTNDCYENLE